jgi:hypothetical protein
MIIIMIIIIIIISSIPSGSFEYDVPSRIPVLSLVLQVSRRFRNQGSLEAGSIKDGLDQILIGRNCEMGTQIGHGFPLRYCFLVLVLVLVTLSGSMQCELPAILALPFQDGPAIRRPESSSLSKTGAAVDWGCVA